MKHFGDIKQLKGSELPIVDIVTGGSPCQDLSVAGNRAGLQGERSGLFMEQIRIIKEMREHDRTNRGSNVDIRLLRPRYMVWENVTGALSSGKPKGEDFRIVLEETARVVDQNAVIPEPTKGGWTPSGCILGNGWSIAWRVHDAQFWGVPQRRKRIALVADFGGSSAPEILFERKSVSRDIESSEQTRKEVAGDIRNSTKESDTTAYTLKVRGRAEFDRFGKRAGKGALIQTELSGTLGVSQDQTLITCSSNDVVSSDGDIAGTLDASYYKGTGMLLQVQSMDSDDSQKCLGIDCYNQSVSEEVSMPLRSINADSDHIPCVAYGVDCYNQSVTGDVAKTLTSGRNDKNNIPCVSTAQGKAPEIDKDNQEEVYTVDMGAGKSSCDVLDNKAPTLATTHYGEPAVCYGLDRASFNQGQNAKYGFSIEEELSPTIVAKGPGGGTDETVGALCARDFKGVGSQYVDEKKIIIQNL